MSDNILVRLRVENKNGRIYISSDDVPGLFLWGKDPKDVLTSVVPAIKELFLYNNGMNVEVVPKSQTIEVLVIVQNITTGKAAHQERTTIHDDVSTGGLLDARLAPAHAK